MTLSKKKTESKLVFNKETGDAETIISREDQLSSLVIASIIEWENFYDGVKTKGHKWGKPLKCNDKNIRKFVLEDGFVAFIGDCREKLREMALAEKESQEKN